MTFKTYTRQDLANYTGRPLASFPESYVANSALPQARPLFKLGTCLTGTDDLSADEKQMVDFAILSMADAIHLVAPYQAAVASPFNSETIGSYSYSKAASTVAMGLPTGIGWFDIAIQNLSRCAITGGDFSGGGIEVFEHDGVTVAGGGGNARLLSPQDIDLSRRFGYDPAPGHQGVPVAPGGGTGGGGTGEDWTYDPENPNFITLGEGSSLIYDPENDGFLTGA